MVGLFVGLLLGVKVGFWVGTFNCALGPGKQRGVVVVVSNIVVVVYLGMIMRPENVRFPEQ